MKTLTKYLKDCFPMFHSERSVQTTATMALKFATNLSFMFTEVPSIIDRYQLAKQAGFKAVESGFPFGFSVQQVAAAKKKANVDQILLNVFTGMLCSYHIYIYLSIGLYMI